MYFKILSNDTKHYGFQYKEGLNVDVNEFDPTPYCGGGLFFSDEKHILGFCNYGDKIAVVTVPEGEQVIRVDTKYKAHSIILSEIRDLWTVETFEWLVSLGVNLYIDNEFVLSAAAKSGHLDVVKYLVEHGADIHVVDDSPLRWAVKCGYSEIANYLISEGADISFIYP